MSLTFLAKSCAYSWKISFAGQVDWKRKLTVCARETAGAASAPAVAAPAAAFFRKRRRWAGLWVGSVMGLVSFVVDPVVSVQRTGARKNLVSFDYRIGLSATLLGLTR
jgi:hypothetical protein